MRAVQLGAFRKLVDIPDIVRECACDVAWPCVTPNLEAELDSSQSASPSDQRILRLALSVHRNLLSTDEDGVGGDLASLIGPAGDAPHPPTPVKKPSTADSQGLFELPRKYSSSY